MRPIQLVAALTAVALTVAALPAESRQVKPRPAAQQAEPSISIDVARLYELGLGPIANEVRTVIAGELATGVGPAGSRVTVKLTGLSLNAYGGTSGGGGDSGPGGGTDFDFLEGDFRIVGPSGEVIAERHQVVSSPSSSGSPFYVPGSEQRRVEAVSRAFASWMKRAA